MTRAITAIEENAWTPIRYRNAVWDPDEQRWVSDAEVAEIALTAFTGRRHAEHVTARLTTPVEQVIADLKNSALAQPSGKFTANAAWPACAMIAYNLTRATCALAGSVHARARTGALRDRLINVPARIALHDSLPTPT